MPIKVPESLPAIDVLGNENIFVMTEYRAMHQDIRPLDVLVLNLMPTKISTETQLLRKLSNTPLQINVMFLTTASYTPQHTDHEHLESFYTTFDRIRDRKFDGMIITGAPLDYVPYEEVEYWRELTEILDWAPTHVHSTLFLCWAMYAALYHYYGIRHHDPGKKYSGIYECSVLKKTSPLFRGFNDVFLAPTSRSMDISKELLSGVPDLEILSDSEEVGVNIIKTTDSRRFFVACHLEYDRMTLDDEYRRDLARGITPSIPKNYYPDNDPERQPAITWKSSGQLLYSNWLNFYVYQTTPYDIREI